MKRQIVIAVAALAVAGAGTGAFADPGSGQGGGQTNNGCGASQFTSQGMADAVQAGENPGQYISQRHGRVLLQCWAEHRIH